MRAPRASIDTGEGGPVDDAILPSVRMNARGLVLFRAANVRMPDQKRSVRSVPNKAKMWHNAHHDQLTGLQNRILFLDRLEQEIKHAKRNCQFLSVVFLDLNGFKDGSVHYEYVYEVNQIRRYKTSALRQIWI